APGNWDELAHAASKVDRQATFNGGVLALAQADAALVAASRNSKTTADQREKLQKQLATAEKALATARADLTRGKTTYGPIGPTYPNKSTGRRAALARWIANRDNPLTPRVAVNHIWGWHFGRPIVESTHDLGRNGKRPSHPELLDWLAVEFMDNGWS